ncbi:vacuolar membrane protein-domain-containing protein, partial [Spinellus fusiger]
LMQDESGCKLLDAFAIRVQLCLATLGFSTLLFKRYREQPQRPLLIWGLDIGKQFMGGSVVHSLNLVASYFTGEYHQGQDANPCVWYFLNVLVDTTLGIGIVWTFLTSVRLLARHYRWKGLESGVYGSPPLSHQMKRWSQQLLVYVCALLVMKAVVVFLFYLFPSVVLFGQWILSWTMGNHRWQVVFVMFIFPLVMNTLQFWVIDTIVKHTHRPIQLPIEDE